MIVSRHNVYIALEMRLEPYTKEQISKIVAAHLAQSHAAASGAH